MEIPRIDMKLALSVAAVLLIANVVQLVFYEGVKKDLDSINTAFVSLNAQFDSYKDTASAQILNLERQNSELNRSYLDLSQNYSTLNGKYSDLGRAYSSLNTSYVNLSVRYSNLTDVYTTILSEIDQYQRNITDFMSWLKSNSNTSGVTDTQTRERVNTMLSSCLNVNGGVCTIKTGCLFIANEQWLDISYKIASLDSLDTFLGRKTGDCKDYSLLYKAEMNYELEKCNYLGGRTITLESYVKNASAGKYWLDFSEGWYLESGNSAFDLPGGYVYPTVICGELYDLNTGNVSGHCMVAFTRNRVTSTSNLNELANAPIVEPQTGEYVGRVGQSSSGISLRPDRKYDSNIFLVITDSDIMLFDEGSKAWNSYSIFNASLSILKSEAINATQENK